MEKPNGGQVMDQMQVGALERPVVEDDRTVQGLAETFQALADPTRVKLISLLVAGELCVGDLAEALRMSVSAISHQLALLYLLRIVRRRREGRNIYYALDDEHIETIYRCGLEHLSHS